MSTSSSIYGRHYTDPEEVAHRWADVLVSHLGVTEASECVTAAAPLQHAPAPASTASTASATPTPAPPPPKPSPSYPQHRVRMGCALPPGWTTDYVAQQDDDALRSTANATTTTAAVDDGAANSGSNSSVPPATTAAAAAAEAPVAKGPASAAPQQLCLKAQPPKTSVIRDHRAKGDCLVAAVDIAAGATIIAEPALMTAPNDPALFAVAAAGARAVESRSSYHGVVARAAAAAAACVRLCTLASSEDDADAGSGGGKQQPAAAASATSRQNAAHHAGASSYPLLRTMCQQWAATLVFHTVLRAGAMPRAGVDTVALGWEVVRGFSACSQAGEAPPPPPAPAAAGALASLVSVTTREEEHAAISEYRTAHWSEWMCAAKLMQRAVMRHLPLDISVTASSPSGNAAAEENAITCSMRRLAAAAAGTANSSSNSNNNNNKTLSPEELCALALDVNGFLCTATIAAYAQQFGDAALDAKSATKTAAAATTARAAPMRKPATRFAYFLDAVASNCVEVSVPGLPKRQALFAYARFCEHECRPACAASFLDAPTLHGSCGHVAGTQIQWDDPIHGALIAGGVRHRRLLRTEKVVVEVKHERSAAGHPIRDYGGGCAVNILLVPAVMCVAAVRDIAAGEPVSIAYVGSTLMTRHERQRELRARYGFTCACIWCAGFAPDLARAFRCPQCPRGAGVVCPRADGSQLNLWECIQCGHHPDVDFVHRCCDSEAALARVRADSSSSTAGVQRLIDDEYVHYSHALVCRKLDAWAERAWRQQEAELCTSIVEVLLRCIDRLGNDDIDGFASLVASGAGRGANSSTSAASAADDVIEVKQLPMITERRAERRGPSRWDVNPPRDLMLAQYLELLGKANHAVGNAHTSRYYYGVALAIRERSGQALSWWCRATRFMAVTKSLADLMDSK